MHTTEVESAAVNAWVEYFERMWKGRAQKFTRDREKVYATFSNAKVTTLLTARTSHIVECFKQGGFSSDSVAPYAFTSFTYDNWDDYAFSVGHPNDKPEQLEENRTVALRFADEMSRITGKTVTGLQYSDQSVAVMLGGQRHISVKMEKVKHWYRAAHPTSALGHPNNNNNNNGGGNDPQQLPLIYPHMPSITYQPWTGPTIGAPAPTQPSAPPTRKVECECGAAKCGSAIHSSWCPKS